MGLLQRQIELQEALLNKRFEVSQPVIREVVKTAPASEERVSQREKRGTVGGTAKRAKSKPKTPADQVRDHLKKHPEDRALSVRQLAQKLKVGKSTVDRVLKE